MTALDRLPSVGVFQTVRARMLFWILAVALPIYAGGLWFAYHETSRRLEAEAVRGADELAARLASGLDALIRPIEGGIYTIAHQLEEIDPPQSQYLKRIRGILDAWPEVFGSTIAVEAGATGAREFAPYLYRKEGAITYSDLALDSYGYKSLPWYRAAADSGRAIWSAPYFDQGGGQAWMITYSVPYFRRQQDGERRLAGVVTADLELAWVRRTVARVPLGAAGMGWVSSGDSADGFIAPIGDTQERVAHFDPDLSEATVTSAATAMLARGRNFGLVPDGFDGKPAYLAVRNLETLGWRLILLTPREALLADARRQLNRQLILGASGLLLLVLAISLVAAGVTRPIHALAEAVAGAGEGELEFSLPERPRRDEVGVLTEALRRMRDSLQHHLQLRAQSLVEAARLEQELQVSAQIQQSMLPHGAAISAVPPSVEIAAKLLPARQVGGDMYDFFPAQNGHLLFVVGDVSDKGIPAALFMAQLSALMRVLGADGNGPDRLLEEVNARLADGNDACMFVTAGCGLLDVESGVVRYASAGHDPPLLCRLEGDVCSPVTDGGAAIGIDSVTAYAMQEIRLAPGDKLLLYTDGVTEAEDETGALFGLERLVELLQGTGTLRPEALVARVVDRVVNHAAGFHATDDLTVLALRFMPADVETWSDRGLSGWQITVDPSGGGLLMAQRRLRCILAARGIVGELCHDVEMIVEECLTNVIRAGGDQPPQHIRMDVALDGSDLALTLRDDGAPFNPLEAEPPDLDIAVTDRPIGGLGIHLVRMIARQCEYRHVEGCNVLTIRLGRHG